MLIPVPGSGAKLIAAVRGQGHLNVVGFGGSDQQFVHFDRSDILAIGGNDPHLPPGVLQPEVGGRRTVDDPQADGLPGAQVGVRVPDLTIGEEGVVVHVRQIHARHAVPFEPGLLAQITSKQGLTVTLYGVALDGVPVGMPLDLSQHLVGALFGEVRQHHYLLLGRDGGGGLNDDGSIQALLFLKFGVGVVPVRSVLNNGKGSEVGFPRLDERGVEHGYSVVLIWKEQSVPVKGDGAPGPVGHEQAGGVALRKVQGGGGNLAVGSQGTRWLTRKIYDGVGYRQAVADHLAGAGRQGLTGNHFVATGLAVGRLLRGEVERKIHEQGAENDPLHGWENLDLK